MDLDTKKIGVILVAVLLAIIIAGETISYANPYYSNFDAERSGNEITYSIDSNLSKDYTAVTMDNGGHYNIERYVAFYDDEYFTPVKNALDSLKWLKHNLEKFNIDLIIAGIDEVKNVIENIDITTALVFATGTLPKEIYSGNNYDLIFDWLGAGGVMYWMDGRLGETYSEQGASKLVHVGSSKANMNFFDTDNLFRNDSNPVYNRDLVDNSLTYVLGIFFNECTHGLKTSGLVDYLSLDYSHEGYSAVTFVKYYNGSGMICNLGGYLNHDTAHSVAQTIASGLTYDSVVIDHHSGQISKDPNGKLQGVSGRTDLFIYIGKMSVIGGQYFQLQP